MPSPDEVYVHCDELNKIPTVCRKNWETELRLLREKLPLNAHVLQVGSMDGTRMIALLDVRPDLQITGIEIERKLVEICRANLKQAQKMAECICGDITIPTPMEIFDYVICLNNTLGYISEQENALKNMRSLGRNVIISVYGEQFSDALALAYFKSLDLTIDAINGKTFMLHDFGTVRTYSRADAESWHGNIVETPIGYFVELEAQKAI